MGCRNGRLSAIVSPMTARGAAPDAVRLEWTNALTAGAPHQRRAAVTSKLIWQILGAVSEFDKAMTVAMEQVANRAFV